MRVPCARCRHNPSITFGAPSVKEQLLQERAQRKQQREQQLAEQQQRELELQQQKQQQQQQPSLTAAAGFASPDRMHPEGGGGFEAALARLEAARVALAVEAGIMQPVVAGAGDAGGPGGGLQGGPDAGVPMGSDGGQLQRGPAHLSTLGPGDGQGSEGLGAPLQAAPAQAPVAEGLVSELRGGPMEPALGDQEELRGATRAGLGEEGAAAVVDLGAQGGAAGLPVLVPQAEQGSGPGPQPAAPLPALHVQEGASSSPSVEHLRVSGVQPLLLPASSAAGALRVAAGPPGATTTGNQDTELMEVEGVGGGSREGAMVGQGPWQCPPGVQPTPSTGMQPAPSTGMQPAPSTGMQPTPSTGMQPAPSTGMQPAPSTGLIHGSEGDQDGGKGPRRDRGQQDERGGGTGPSHRGTALEEALDPREEGLAGSLAATCAACVDQGEHGGGWGTAEEEGGAEEGLTEHPTAAQTQARIALERHLRLQRHLLAQQRPPNISQRYLRLRRRCAVAGRMHMQPEVCVCVCACVCVCVCAVHRFAWQRQDSWTRSCTWLCTRAVCTCMCTLRCVFTLHCFVWQQGHTRQTRLSSNACAH